MSHKEHIVEQAMQMFVAQGIKSVRMDDIAQHLRVSKRTLYELFGDKEELLYQAMSAYLEQARCRREELARGAADIIQAMFVVLQDVMNFSSQTNRMLANLRKFYPAVSERLQVEGSERGRNDLRKMLYEGIKQGFFIDSFNVDLSISVLYYSSAAIISDQKTMLPEGLSARRAFVQIISTFFRGVATEKGMRLIDLYRERYMQEQNEY